MKFEPTTLSLFRSSELAPLESLQMLLRFSAHVQAALLQVQSFELTVDL
jgi:hypothetical protein